MLVYTRPLSLYFLENCEMAPVETRMLKEGEGGEGGDIFDILLQMLVYTRPLSLYFLENCEKAPVDTRMLKEGGWAFMQHVEEDLPSPCLSYRSIVSGHVVFLGDVIKTN